MKKLFKLIFLIMFFCMVNINVLAFDEDSYIELDEKMYLNPEWLEYIKLSDEEKRNFEAIPEQYIYDYEPKVNILNNYSMNYFSLDNGLSREPYFTLADINGKRYVNSSNKDQSSLGLCWAFASIGAIESNIMLNGVVGEETCNNNSTSKYCQNEQLYIEDKKLNEYYINNAISCESGNCLDINGNLIVDSNNKPKKVVIDNATFSERHIDYLRSKPYPSNAYNNTNGSYTLIKEEYNYYTSNSQMGSGDNYSTVGKYLGYGIAPVRMKGIWEDYKISHDTYTLEQVFDSEKSLYQIKNYYVYPSTPSRNSQTYETDLALWVDELKKNIVKYGSLYVSTGVPDSRYGTCYFYDSKNNIKLMNNTGNCGKSASHALQIIGWDDKYQFGYCKITKKRVYDNGEIASTTNYSTSNVDGFANKSDCELEKIVTGEITVSGKKEKYTETTSGIWTEGKGAWILKNSWGAGSDLYPYLSYQSNLSSLFGVREVGINNFDNTYNSKNSKKNNSTISVERDGISVKESVFTYKKTNNKEYLNGINFYSSSSNIHADVYVKINDEYEYLDTIFIDYAGLYSIDINNYEVFGNEFSIKIVGPNISEINAFTLNQCSINGTCTTETEIHSYIESSATVDLKYFPEDNTNFEIYTTTKNIKSGAKLNYAIYNANGDNLSSKFELNSNYVIKNVSKGTVKLIDDIEYGEYTLEISYDDVKEYMKFNIVDNIDIEFETKYPIFVGDKDIKITPKLSSTEGTGNFVWKSSNNNIATIDSNGVLTAIKSGVVTITFTSDTYFGKVSKRLQLYVYKKINNVEDFMNMLINNSSVKEAYYLTTDLDFKDINFKNYNEKSFNDILDGANHTLKNINKSSSVAGEQIGLFNKASGARISNLKIIDSSFESLDIAGSLIGYASNCIITGIYSSADVKSKYIAGGIVGDSKNSEISESFNEGEVSAISAESESYAGGIIGRSINDYIYDSYNDGKVYSETKFNAINSDNSFESYAGGIIGNILLDSGIEYSYNKGNVISYSSNEYNKLYSNGLTAINLESYNLEDFIYNSYYLYDEMHSIKYPPYSKTINELKNKSTFEEWDFENVWYIRDEKITPVLRRFPVEVENVEFKLNNILNTDSIYEFEYEVTPYSVSDDVEIFSEDTSLFEVIENKIITKNKSGTCNIVFKVDNKEYKYPITIKPIITYQYDNTITNKDIEVSLDINYYNELIDNSYLKLEYSMGDNTYTKKFDNNVMENTYSFIVSENSIIDLKLYACNSECNLVDGKNFEITNIDKKPPVINVESNNILSTLKINVSDIESGLSDNNKYEFAITNSDTIIPTDFGEYIPNEVMNNIFMNHISKYLWIKNISDNIGNNVSNSDYIIYELVINNVDAEKIDLDIFSNILNYNKEYEFNYEITPKNITHDVIIESGNKDLFEIYDNKIVTKDKSGTGDIVFKVGSKVINHTITIRDILEYSYDENLTNNDVLINLDIGYYDEIMSNSYLKLEYSIDGNTYTKEFDNNMMENTYSFSISENSIIDLKLYACNSECNLVDGKNFEITNIDKKPPVISVESNNILSTLKINVSDIESGLSDNNKYEFAITNSDTIIPTDFGEYRLNEVIDNIFMNHISKYLWIKNISDNVGNKVSNNEYIIYELDIKNVDVEKIDFNLSGNILNYNNEYEFNYEIIPKNITHDVIIESGNKDLFEIHDNKIVTKDKSGIGDIIFKVGTKEIKHSITVKDILEYSYDDKWTNSNVVVNLDINYYTELLIDSNLRLDYRVGDKTYSEQFGYNEMRTTYSFNVEKNSNIDLKLYICNIDCNLVDSKNFEITNIDKEPPVISVESNNFASTLKINVSDIGSGLADNNYEYAISNNDIIVPTHFNRFEPNQEMNNIFMNHLSKYLWVKNVSDNVGNKASINEYMIYELDINNVDVETIDLDIFSNILNYNKEYEFNYEITPKNITHDVIIESGNKDLFEIYDNKIVTKDKSGTGDIVFKVGSKVINHTITIKDTLEYSYDENLTNNDIFVKIHTNYFEGVLDEFAYLKLIYKIGGNEYVKEFDKNISINEYTFIVGSNSNINLDLYLCGTDCKLINSKNFDILNIDKEKPVLNYVADNINKTLKINVGDLGVAGLSNNNIYKYAISNSNKEVPKTFKKYVSNVTMENVVMNKEYKYLWVYNISDNVGNKISNNEFIIYEIDLQTIYYNINYYSEDKKTILKSEKIKEDDVILINFKPDNYQDNLYFYEFDYWDGYSSGMKATKDINLYAVYRKTFKELTSNLYIIEDGYIKNIKLDDLNKEYSVELFKSNLNNYESFSFYDSINSYIPNINNIKTGMKFRNNVHEYKIVLAGDVTGDGKVKMNDVMKIANHLVNKNVLENEYLLAGDVTGDDNIKMNDVMKIANILVNGGSL